MSPDEVGSSVTSAVTVLLPTGRSVPSPERLPLTSQTLAGVGTMALSEDEQRRLDEMERALTRDDPRFAAGVSIDHLRRRRRIVSACVFLIGILVLLTGLVITAESATAGVVIGVAGSLIMIAAAVAVFLPRRRRRRR